MTSELGGTCGHCGREDVGADLPGGYASAGDVLLCHPDNVTGRPNCYVLVTVYHHKAVDCAPCRVAGVTKKEEK